MNHSSPSPLSTFWQRYFSKPATLAGALILLWGIPRFIIVLNANQTGQYHWVSLIFISMWLTPWIFLSGDGRKKAGLKRPSSFLWLIAGLVAGSLACLILFMVAQFLFGDSINNWFVYISSSYSNVPKAIGDTDRLIFFLIYAGIGILFSPVGEEFFYRGVIHECFALSLGDRKASWIDSAAFSITHLAHFGIVYEGEKWHFLPLAAFLWVILLFFTCLLFFYFRKKSGSILGAILAHAGFNVMMSYLIFYYLL